jgi:hypothetical protein
VLLSLSLSLSLTVAHAGVIETCYGDAESDNAGLSVTVKVGGVTQYSGDDLDSVFDKIAEHYESGTLAVSYNTDGKNSLTQAMDCVFDHDMVTLSAVWLNRNDASLQVRTYDVRLFDETPALVANLWFTAMDDGPRMRFNSSAGECVSVATTTASTYDKKFDIGAGTSIIVACDNQDCDGACRVSVPGECVCSGLGGCIGILNTSWSGGNGTMVRGTLLD